MMTLRRWIPLLLFTSWFAVVLLQAEILLGQDEASRSQPASAETGVPKVEVSEEDGRWTIQGQKQVVTLDAKDLALRVEAGPAVWNMVASEEDDMLAKGAGREFPLRLADAGSIEIVPYHTGFKSGVKITLSEWEDDEAENASEGPLDLTLYLTVALEGKDEELVFTVAADENETVVRRLDWPTALNTDDFSHTVLSNVRGVLLPRDWAKPYHPIRPLEEDGTIQAGDTSEVQSNVIESWSMSWWGFHQGPSALMVIVETPDDAAYQFEHPAGGPTVIGPRWRTSLGKLGYVRTARMCFFPEGDYVDMAKRYRRYAMETGLFVSLKEKIARTQIVEELIGTPLMRSGILTNIKEGSARFKRAERPSDNYRLTTFDERGEYFRQLKSDGLDRLTVVLTGWPKLGYDREHPDVLPPAPVAGGYEGMRRLAETCAELGYIFSLHDQYRDYYVDSPSYDEQFAIHEEDAESEPQAFPGSRFGDWKEGRIPFMDYWDGGKMTYINGRFMLGHLEKNYQGLFDHEIRPQGNYLDVFGYVPPDEDFNPQHPTTRADCLRERGKCYDWSRHHLGFVGTEAACDWTVPYADISSPLSQSNGIAIPLFNLVYHDAIMTTYSPSDLHGFLNAGVPQISGREPIGRAMPRIERMRALHKRLALVELTDHEFLDDNFRRERTTFADGTTVTVDWDDETVVVAPELTAP